MRKLAGYLGLAVLVALLAPASASAQAKIRIAIWDFENNSERAWWFADQLGPAVRNHIDTAFSENRTLSDKFSVVEREKLDMVMKEQGLATAGALDPQSAAKVGKILGVKYILTGGVDKFAINTTGGGFRGIGGNMTQADATINMRFIDTTTAERIVSISAEGEVKKGGGFIRGASLSRDAEWGIASETLEKASAAVVQKLLTGDYLGRIQPGGGPAGGMEGTVAKADGKTVYINIGSSSGVKVGDNFRFFKIGEALIDPDTGQSLGAASEKEVGTGTVTEVQERFAVLTVTGTASVKDKARKQ